MQPGLGDLPGLVAAVVVHDDHIQRLGRLSTNASTRSSVVGNRCASLYAGMMIVIKGSLFIGFAPPSRGISCS